MLALPAFKNLPKNLWRSLQNKLAVSSYPSDALVFNEGDIGDNFYVIMGGKVGVLIRERDELLSDIQDTRGVQSQTGEQQTKQQDRKNAESGNEHQQQSSKDHIASTASDSSRPHLVEWGNEKFSQVRTLENGDTFGEMALTANQPRSATIITRGRVIMVSIHQKAYSMLTAALGMSSGVSRGFTVDQAHESLEILKTPPQSRSENSVTYLAEMLKLVGFFSGISDYVRKDLCRELGYERYSRNSTIFSQVNDHFPSFAFILSSRLLTSLVGQGDPGSRMYIIFAGKVQLLSMKDTGTEDVITTLVPGSAFGELAILRRAPRSATAIAIEDTALASLGADKYDKKLRSEHLRELGLYMDFISKVGLFKRLPHGTLLRLSHCAHTQDFPSGTQLFKQETIPKSVFIIKTGECELHRTFHFSSEPFKGRHQRKQTLRMARVGSNEVLALSQAVLGWPAMLSAVAKTPLRCVIIPAHDFRSALSQEVIANLKSVCKERERFTKLRIDRATSTLSSLAEQSSRDYQNQLFSSLGKQSLTGGRDYNSADSPSRPASTVSARARSSTGFRTPSVLSTRSTQWPDVGAQGFTVGLSRAGRSTPSRPHHPSSPPARHVAEEEEGKKPTRSVSAMSFISLPK